jgi:hypothetical protein
MTDVQLSNRKHPDIYVFIDARQTTRTLMFTFKKVKWYAETETNKPLGTVRIHPSKFSKHYNRLMRQGWRICG